MTDEELEAIRQRQQAAAAVILSVFCRTLIAPGAITQSARDVPALLRECDRLMVQLSDCWLFLEWIANHCVDDRDRSLRACAATILRDQHAPGWEGDSHSHPGVDPDPVRT